MEEGGLRVANEGRKRVRMGLKWMKERHRRANGIYEWRKEGGGRR